MELPQAFQQNAEILAVWREHNLWGPGKRQNNLLQDQQLVSFDGNESEDDGLAVDLVVVNLADGGMLFALLGVVVHVVSQHLVGEIVGVLGDEVTDDLDDLRFFFRINLRIINVDARNLERDAVLVDELDLVVLVVGAACLVVFHHQFGKVVVHLVVVVLQVVFIVAVNWFWILSSSQLTEIDQLLLLPENSFDLEALAIDMNISLLSHALACC